MKDWRSQLRSRLVDAIGDTGAWGYRSGGVSAAEPTALAALALTAADHPVGPCVRALDWLGQSQHEDGAVPVMADLDSPHWTTALALLAWAGAPESKRSRYRTQIERAQGWLLQARGRTFKTDPAKLSHDTTLVGWPWVADTHSWVEPTAYAVMALRATGHSANSRVREAIRLILDRSLAAGGWNYGNRRVLGRSLNAFPATTGIALTALSGEPAHPFIDAAVAYLESELPRIEAPLSLSWGLIGLRARGAAPAAAESWLEKTARRIADRPVPPHYLAMLLHASMDPCPLLKLTEAKTYA